MSCMTRTTPGIRLNKLDWFGSGGPRRFVTSELCDSLAFQPYWHLGSRFFGSASSKLADNEWFGRVCLLKETLEVSPQDFFFFWFLPVVLYSDTSQIHQKRWFQVIVTEVRNWMKNILLNKANNNIQKALSISISADNFMLFCTSFFRFKNVYLLRTARYYGVELDWSHE